MKFIATLLAGGTLFAADLPNPEVGECITVDVAFTYTEPTMLDPDGTVTGAREWQACGYQVPTGTGSNMRAVDGVFWKEHDRDQAELWLAASRDLLDNGGVYLPTGGRP